MNDEMNVDVEVVNDDTVDVVNDYDEATDIVPCEESGNGIGGLVLFGSLCAGAGVLVYKGVTKLAKFAKAKIDEHKEKKAAKEKKTDDSEAATDSSDDEFENEEEK